MSDDDQNKGRSTRSSAARKLYSVGHDPSPARLGCSQWGTGSHEICRGRPYVVMKKSFRTRVTTGVVLGAVLALSIVDSALAATCAANTFYPGGTGGTSSSCTACPTGTTAAAIPDHTGSRTYCEGIDANYYGTAGNVSSVDAAVTACPYGGTSSASPSTSTAVTDCTPQCGTGTNAEVNAGTCRCEANYYGTPKDTNDAELLVVTQGCTACPYDGTSSAASGAISGCTPQCGTGTNAEVNAGTCRCEANYYGTPKDTNDAELLVVTQGCTACPYDGTSSAASGAISGCTPQCGTGTNAEVNAGTCRCEANYYGTPKDTNDAELLVVTQGCTACPYDGTSSAASGAISGCTPQCGTGTNAEVNAGTCRCEANYYGTPKDTNDAELLVVTQGCTACPSGSTSSAGSAAQSSCNCDASAAPTNGLAGNCTDSLASGSTCQPTCNSGYTVSGTSSCNTGTLTAATCSANACDASTAPTNGGVGDCTNSLASGSTCQPTCSSGYSVFGTSSCTAGTLTAAKCLANPCDASTAPTNGDVGACTRSLPSGAACQPTCNSGYTVSGTSSCSLGTLTAATCSANPAPAVPKLMLGIILTVVCGLIVSAAVFYVYQRRRRRRLGSSSFRQFVAEFNRGVEMT
jgi:uncharacterized protein (DUF427 family)